MRNRSSNILTAALRRGRAQSRYRNFTQQYSFNRLLSRNLSDNEIKFKLSNNELNRIISSWTTRNLYIHNNTMVNLYINELFNAYYNSNFTYINHKLNEICIDRDAIFITEDKYYDDIYQSFLKLVKVKNNINRYITRKRFSKRNWIYTNDRDLSLNYFSPEQNIFEFRNYNDKTIQKFTISEINNIFKFSIFNSNPNYSYPSPHIPRNPYTNNEFNTGEIISMYKFLLKVFASIGKCIPEYIVIFKNSYFNIDILMQRYKNYLCYHSTVYFVNNLSDDYWKYLLKLVILNEAFATQSSCLTCITSKYNYRELFDRVLILNELNTNSIYDYGDAGDLYNDICTKNNLVFDSQHWLTHRRFVKAKRSLPQQSNNQVEPIIQSYLVPPPPYLPSSYISSSMFPFGDNLPINISTFPQPPVINAETQTNSIIEHDINETVEHFMNQIMNTVSENIETNN